MTEQSFCATKALSLHYYDYYLYYHLVTKNAYVPDRAAMRMVIRFISGINRHSWILVTDHQKPVKCLGLPFPCI